MTNSNATSDQLTDEDLTVIPRPIYAFEQEGVQAVDRAAIEEYGIPSILLMENAARAVADEILCLEAERSVDQPHRPVLILCGKGNNGADGLALARHLHNEGFIPTIALAFDTSQPVGTEELHTHLQIVDAMEIPIFEIDAARPAEALNAILQEMGIERNAPHIIVDALLGTGLANAPQPPIDQIIHWVNDHDQSEDSAIVAVDVPSGLDCDTGLPLGVDAVRAELTVTFVGLKKGFLEAAAQPFIGDLAIGDIGAPVELLERFGRIVTADQVFDEPTE